MHGTLPNAKKWVHIKPSCAQASVSTRCPFEPTPTLPKKTMAALPKRIIKVSLPSPPSLRLARCL